MFLFSSSQFFILIYILSSSVNIDCKKNHPDEGEWLCANETCTEPISQATATNKYLSPDDTSKVRVDMGYKLLILRKPKDPKEKLHFVQLKKNGQTGLLASNLFREDRIFHKDESLKPVKFRNKDTEDKTPDINPSAPTNVYEGTTIVEYQNEDNAYLYEPTQSPGSPSQFQSTTPPAVSPEKPVPNKDSEGDRSHNATDVVKNSLKQPNSSYNNPNSAVTDDKSFQDGGESHRISSTPASPVLEATPSPNFGVPKDADVPEPTTEVPRDKNLEKNEHSQAHTLSSTGNTSEVTEASMPKEDETKNSYSESSEVRSKKSENIGGKRRRQPSQPTQSPSSPAQVQSRTPPAASPEKPVPNKDSEGDRNHNATDEQDVVKNSSKQPNSSYNNTNSAVTDDKSSQDGGESSGISSTPASPTFEASPSPNFGAPKDADVPEPTTEVPRDNLEKNEHSQAHTLSSKGNTSEITETTIPKEDETKNSYSESSEVGSKKSENVGGQRRDQNQQPEVNNEQDKQRSSDPNLGGEQSPNNKESQSPVTTDSQSVPMPTQPSDGKVPSKDIGKDVEEITKASDSVVNPVEHDAKPSSEQSQPEVIVQAKKVDAPAASVQTEASASKKDDQATIANELGEEQNTSKSDLKSASSEAVQSSNDSTSVDQHGSTTVGIALAYNKSDQKEMALGAPSENKEHSVNEKHETSDSGSQPQNQYKEDAEQEIFIEDSESLDEKSNTTVSSAASETTTTIAENSDDPTIVTETPVTESSHSSEQNNTEMTSPSEELVSQSQQFSFSHFGFVDPRVNPTESYTVSASTPPPSSDVPPANIEAPTVIPDPFDSTVSVKEPEIPLQVDQELSTVSRLPEDPQTLDQAKPDIAQPPGTDVLAEPWYSELLSLISGIKDMISSSSPEKAAIPSDSETSQVTCPTNAPADGQSESCDAESSIPIPEKVTGNDDDLMGDVTLSPRVIIIMTITTIAVLFFSLGHYYLENMRRDYDLISKCNDLSGKLFIEQKEKEMLADQLRSSNESMEQYKFDTTKYDEEISELRALLDRYREEKAAIEEREKETNRKYVVVDKNYNELRKILSQTKQKGDRSALQIDIENLKERIAANNVEIASLQEQLLKKKEEIKSLNVKVMDCMEINKQLEKNIENTISASNERDQKYQESIQRLERTIDESTVARIKLEKQCAQLKKEKESLSLEKELAETSLLKFQRLSSSGALTEWMDVKEVRVSLLAAEKKLEELTQIRDSFALDKTKLEEKERTLTADLEQLNEKYEKAEQEKIEALTRLQVLSDYFQEKQTQLQEELGTKEAICLQKQSDDRTIYEQMRALREENTSYKKQNETLKREILDQEASFKKLITSAEEKAHENWVALRHQERRLKEAQMEASQLRSRLTALESAGDIPDDKMNKGEVNGDIPQFGSATSPPFMLYPEFVPPPPLMSGAPSRPPPLGRISSPPLGDFTPPPPLVPYEMFLPPSPPPPIPAGVLHKPQPIDGSRRIQKDSQSSNHSNESAPEKPRRNKR